MLWMKDVKKPDIFTIARTQMQIILGRMNKSNSIKLRLSMNLTADDLGFSRLYDELKCIESNTTLTADEIAAAKRRHLLVILYQYSLGAMPTLTSFMAVPSVVSTSPLDMTTADPKFPIPRTQILGSLAQAIPVQATDRKETTSEAINAASIQALNDIGASFTNANPGF